MREKCKSFLHFHHEFCNGDFDLDETQAEQIKVDDNDFAEQAMLFNFFYICTYCLIL